jgi:hypothetical protein
MRTRVNKAVFAEIVMIHLEMSNFSVAGAVDCTFALLFRKAITRIQWKYIQTSTTAPEE